MSQQKNSFFDFRTILAILLMMFFWIGWESYLAKKYPNRNKPVSQTATTTPATTEPTTPDVTATKQGQIAKSAAPLPAEVQPVQEQSVSFEHANIMFEISSHGMGLKNVVLKKYVDRAGKQVVVGANKGVLPFQTSLRGRTEALQFSIQRISETEYLGQANTANGTITKRIQIDAENYVLKTTVEVQGQVDGITTYISEDVFSKPEEVPEGKRIFGDTGTGQSFFISHGGTTDHQASTAEEPANENFKDVGIGAMGTRYFAMALVDNGSKVIPEFQTGIDNEKKTFYGALTYPSTGGSEFTAQYKAFIGPKNLDTLRKVDSRLDGILDFGMFSALATGLLVLMKWLFGFFQNWGVAIIVLTILVRLAVLPFNIMSYKSMKAMQVVQPQIKRLQEKYKNDRETLNREMMTLMKTHKVNPLGGCLPMLLQLPVFFALYQVLDLAIELYRAPFMLWLTDLSLKDPYFVLPVLMGITMFIQQKITPTTMDPAQAKVMMFMPIIFTFFMISLPSGLTLYIFISSLFGIIQQLVFMRDKRVESNKPVRLEA